MMLRDRLNFDFLRHPKAVPAIIALGIAIAAGFGVQLVFFGGEPEPPPAPPPAPPPVPVEVPVVEPPPPVVAEPEPPSYSWVLVAKSDIDSATMLTPDLVEWREWSEPTRGGRFLLQDEVPLQAVLGSVVQQPYAAGAPLGWDGIIAPGGPGFIRAVLKPGMQAMTVNIDRATTNANLIHPGDWVDVILTSTNDDETKAVSQAIVRDVRVLAVGSTLFSFNHLGYISSQDGVPEPVRPPDGDTYTLELSPKDAERVALAVSMGQLTLAMRSAYEIASGARQLRRPVSTKDVLVDPWLPQAATPVRIIRGGAVEVVAVGETP